ncbi:MAG: phosphodiesterase [Pseudomonadota bacterium]|nr:phosphodiesterase [Pseudomonadota bacterium]
MKFIHATDTHLVPPGDMLCALHPAKRLSKLVAQVNQSDNDAEFLVLTGDLSYHGMEPAYRALREILSKLSIPFHLLIGNHDDRESFKRIFPETATDEGGFVQYVVEYNAGVFIMLDTVEHEQSHGRLCPARLSWLEEQLSRHPDRPVYLFLHHPPFKIGINSLDNCMLHDPEPLGQLLKRHGGVKHIFYGHVHRPISGSWLGIPATTLPGTNHQVGLYLGSESDMAGSHEPPAYGVCLINDDSVVVHMRNFLDDSPRFKLSDPSSKSALRPAELSPLPGAFIDQV